MPRQNRKRAWKEFTEFYALCYIANKRITITATLFVILAVIDEFLFMLNGEGLVIRLIHFITSYRSIFSI